MRPIADAEPLPVGFVLEPGETILWQGRPERRALARGLFRLRWVVAYFALLLLWKLALILWARGPRPQDLHDAAILALQGVALFGLIAFFARALSRATTYTVTDARVVIRHGIALSATIDIPLRAIRSVALRLHADGAGDIALGVRRGGGVRPGRLWPHMHGVLRPMPLLRALPEAAIVGPLLCRQLDLAATRNPAGGSEPAEPPRHRDAA